ncbi:MAG: hypothetical protein ACLUD2_03115 [Clostridium sp.]
MVWCVAATGSLSAPSAAAATLRQVILGGYVFGLSRNLHFLIIMGNYGLGLQMHGKA